MITPAFEITQDEVYLYITIKAPYSKVSEAEVYIEDCQFKFFASPYYLRLNLPGAIVENGREKAKFDYDKCVYEIQVAKAKKGEVFEGLDLLTKLLATSANLYKKQPTIELLSDEPTEGTDEYGEEEEEYEFDWQIEQQPAEEFELSSQGSMYGFANQKSNILFRLQSEFPDLVDLPSADSIPLKERRALREKAENEKFDPEHYVGDFYDDESIKDLLKFNPEWLNELTKSSHKQNYFSEDENERMRKLPRKQLLLDSLEEHIVLLSLVDIVYAYVYNYLTTEGENTVESGWTISKLSSTLSWLDTGRTLKDCITTCYRRSLCYPLYRHWALCQKVFNETCNIFKIGRERLLKCLLEIHRLFIDSDQRYVLNDLYITDYCVWIQSANKKSLDSLLQQLVQVTITKEDVGFPLEELENIPLLNEDHPSDLTEQLEALHITGNHTQENKSVFLPDEKFASSTDSETSTDTDTELRRDKSTEESTDTESGSSIDSDCETNSVLEKELDTHENITPEISKSCVDKYSLKF